MRKTKVIEINATAMFFFYWMIMETKLRMVKIDEMQYTQRKEKFEIQMTDWQIFLHIFDTADIAHFEMENSTTNVPISDIFL